MCRVDAKETTDGTEPKFTAKLSSYENFYAHFVASFYAHYVPQEIQPYVNLLLRLLSKEPSEVRGACKFGGLMLKFRYCLVSGGTGREEPVFMRNKGANSPVFPPELVLPEGPLAVALPSVNKPLKSPSFSEERAPKWGESR